MNDIPIHQVIQPWVRFSILIWHFPQTGFHPQRCQFIF
jgi:hypothetical protein